MPQLAIAPTSQRHAGVTATACRCRRAMMTSGMPRQNRAIAAHVMRSRAIMVCLSGWADRSELAGIDSTARDGSVAVEISGQVAEVADETVNVASAVAHDWPLRCAGEI
jgi:hypothetical protein